MSEIISVISAKGGVGKTSIAVSLAHAAACYGLKTLRLFVRGKVILQPQGKEFFT